MNSINGLTYTIDDSLNYNVKFPNNLLESTVDDIAFIVSIVWKVNPKLPDFQDDYFIAPPFISIFLVGNNQQVSLSENI